jgi:hypothetical protein
VNLDALGNIGEFVGSIGVIVSLIYLAFQVRANTRSNYSESIDRISTDLQSFILDIFRDEKTNYIYGTYIMSQAGIADVKESDELDIRLILTAAFMDVWRAYEKYERGQVEEEAWNVVLGIFRTTYLQSPIARHWMEDVSIFPDSFMMFLAKEMKES